MTNQGLEIVKYVTKLSLQILKYVTLSLIMVYKRKIYNDFLEWKKNWSSRRALLVQGARRIGKSTIVEEFAQKEYKSYILINFQFDKNKVKDLFENMSSLDEFFRNLSLIYGVKLYEKESIIIFDEVQRFTLARESIKQLVLDGRYHYMETGSLISLRHNTENILIPSEERTINMYPMDFEEFLWACGDEVTAEAIKENFRSHKPFGDIMHRLIMKKFRTYLAVGGMPEAVSEFIETNDYARVDLIKRDILSLYEADLKKLDDDTHLSTSLILKAVPSELSSSSRLFRTVALGSNSRMRRAYSSFDAIEESMVVNIASSSMDPTCALSLTRDFTRQKIYMADTGLLVSQIFRSSKEPINDSIYTSLITDKISLNIGMVIENAVAQALKTNGYDLYFYMFDHYEIDFLLQNGKKVIPIEVKSSSYSTHKSLDVFSEKYSSRVDNTRYVIYSKDLKKEGNIMFVPFYMTMCL